MKTIGLVGGMSWESTIPYYRIINEEVKNRLGGLHSTKIVLYSVEFDEIEKCLTLTNNGALYPKDSRDAVIIYSINRGLTLAETNSLLYSKGMELLGQTKE